MIQPPRERLDEVEVLGAALCWTADPDHLWWLRAEYDGSWIHMKLNSTFPDVALYSLLLEKDVMRELDDLPDRWTRGPLVWPPSAS